jgi:hypothetical protein
VKPLGKVSIMLMEEPCPRCQGPATFCDGQICCVLCGDFEHEGTDCLIQAEKTGSQHSVSLLFPPPRTQEAPQVSVQFSDAVPDDFPRESIVCKFPDELRSRFPGTHEDEFPVRISHAFEFFFGYVESYGGLPELEVGFSGTELQVELLSSHAFRLGQLHKMVQRNKVELCEFAFLLYSQFLQEKEAEEGSHGD